MLDREKVIQAITNCTDEALVCSKGCDCPYWQDDRHIVCWDNLMKDALELLKKQEPITPRIVQLKEIKEGEPYWFSTMEDNKPTSHYAICVHREEDAGWPYITFVWQHGTSSWPMDKYGYSWCCWSSKPN